MYVVTMPGILKPKALIPPGQHFFAARIANNQCRVLISGSICLRGFGNFAFLSSHNSATREGRPRPEGLRVTMRNRRSSAACSISQGEIAKLRIKSRTDIALFAPPTLVTSPAKC